VEKNDTVYDLGSGDGRIVIAAAKKGARAIGFEMILNLCKNRGRISAKRALRTWRKSAMKKS
jgi:hypothetical protein